MRRDSRRTSSSVDLLEVSDPVGHVDLASVGIEGALDEIGGAIASSPRRAPQKRSTGNRRTVVVVAVTLVAISAGIATGAVMLGAHTGLFPTKAEQAMGGPGEALNPAATDFRKVALQIGSDISYPKGYASWRDWFLAETFRSFDGGTDPGGAVSAFPAGLVSSGALHGWFAASAFCAWVQSWRQASIAGDQNATAQAAQTIASAPGWKAVTDEDPNPNPSASNDAGAVTGTLFGWMLPYRDAVMAGDRARVEHLLATGYGDGKCWSNDPAWMAQLAAHHEWRSLSPAALAQKYEQFLEA